MYSEQGMYVINIYIYGDKHTSTRKEIEIFYYNYIILNELHGILLKRIVCDKKFPVKCRSKSSKT